MVFAARGMSVNASTPDDNSVETTADFTVPPQAPQTTIDSGLWGSRLAASGMRVGAQTQSALETDRFCGAIECAPHRGVLCSV